MQMVTSWMEGGEQKAALKMLRRVGAIDPVIDQRLQLLSVPQLENLLNAALDFSEPPELLSWLDTKQSVE
jgi:hypothetical protein